MGHVTNLIPCKDSSAALLCGSTLHSCRVECSQSQSHEQSPFKGKYLNLKRKTSKKKLPNSTELGKYFVRSLVVDGGTWYFSFEISRPLVRSCGVLSSFQGGLQNQIKMPKNQHTQRKLLIGVVGRCQKVPKCNHQRQFSMSKIVRIFLNSFFFIEEYQFMSTFF